MTRTFCVERVLFCKLEKLRQMYADWKVRRKTSRRILKIIDKQEKISKYLLREYLDPFLLRAKPDLKQLSEKERVIWQYWDTGLERAPKIVKTSVKSVRKHLPSGYKHVLLTDENIYEYVQIPDWVKEKRRNNPSFRTTFFSDILRLFLLEKYGGIWIDATIFMSSEIPAYILKSPFFCFYRGAEPRDALVYESFNPTYFSWRPEFKVRQCNSFLVADKSHPFVSALKEMLLSYWEREDEIRHYFIFQLLFEELIKTPPYSGIKWDCENDLRIHRMLFEVKKSFNQEQWDEICSSCYVHKLTYYKDAGKDSFYSYIEQLGS